MRAILILACFACSLCTTEALAQNSQPPSTFSYSSCDQEMPGLGGYFCLSNGSATMWKPFSGDFSCYTGPACSPTDSSKCGQCTVKAVNGEGWNYAKLPKFNGNVPVWNAANQDWEPAASSAALTPSTGVQINGNAVGTSQVATGFINGVTDLGMKCDHVTDDYVAAMAAINTACLSGQPLIFPPTGKQCYVSKPLVVSGCGLDVSSGTGGFSAEQGLENLGQYEAPNLVMIPQYQTVNITSITESGSTATVTTGARSPDPLTCGPGVSPCGWVNILNLTGACAGYNGYVMPILSIPDNTHLTYTANNTGLSTCSSQGVVRGVPSINLGSPLIGGSGNSYIVTNNGNNFDFRLYPIFDFGGTSTPLTVDGWENKANAGDVVVILASEQGLTANTGGPLTTFRNELELNDTGSQYECHMDVNGSQAVAVGGVPTSGTHYLLCEYVPTTGNLTLYVDGTRIQQTSSLGNHPITFDPTGDLTMGYTETGGIHSPHNVNSTVGAKIDQPRISNIARCMDSSTSCATPAARATPDANTLLLYSPNNIAPGLTKLDDPIVSGSTVYVPVQITHQPDGQLLPFETGFVHDMALNQGLYCQFCSGARFRNLQMTINVMGLMLDANSNEDVADNIFVIRGGARRFGVYEQTANANWNSRFSIGSSTFPLVVNNAAQSSWRDIFITPTTGTVYGSLWLNAKPTISNYYSDEESGAITGFIADMVFQNDWSAASVDGMELDGGASTYLILIDKGYSPILKSAYFGTSANPPIYFNSLTGLTIGSTTEGINNNSGQTITNEAGEVTNLGP